MTIMMEMLMTMHIMYHNQNNGKVNDNDDDNNAAYVG